MSVGVGGSGKEVAPGASGASEAELLGGRPGVTGDCETGEGLAAGFAGVSAAGLLPVGAVPGGVTRLGLVDPAAGDAVGNEVGVTLVPVGGDGVAAGVAPEPVDGDDMGAGDALVPVDVEGDAGEPVG